MPGYGFTQNFLSGAGESLDLGQGAERFYLNAAKAFDPNAYVAQVAEGAGNTALARLRREMPALQGREVGAGRLETGYGVGDEMDLKRTISEDMNSKILEASLQGASLYQRNLEGIGAFGSRATERGYDLLASERDAQTAERNAKRENVLGWVNAGANVLRAVASFIPFGGGQAPAGGK